MNRRLRLSLLAAPLLCAVVLLAVPGARPDPARDMHRDDVILPELVTIEAAGPPDAAGNVRLVVRFPLAELEGAVRVDYRLPKNVAVPKRPRTTAGTAASLRGTSEEFVVRPMDSAPAPVFVTVSAGGLRSTAGVTLNPPPFEPDRGVVRQLSNGRTLHLYPGEAQP